MFQMLFLLAFLVPAILFLITQQNVLSTVQPANRLMNPGLVWLQLIPLFGQLWQFIVVSKISDSIRKEFISTKDDSIIGISGAGIAQLDNRPGFNIGIAYCILFTTGILINLLHKASPDSIWLIGPLFTLSGMICWIIYWIELVKYKNRLKKLRRE